MRSTLLLAAVLSFPAPAASLAGPASDAVKFFYAPVRYEADAKYRSRFTEPVTKLFELNDKATKGDGQIGCIDFGPGLDAQDYDEKTVARTLKLSEKIDGDSGEVTASFDLFPQADGSRREMVWSLKKIDGKWKIADIASRTSGWKLSELGCLPDQE
jgi:hypothetical protein